MFDYYNEADYLVKIKCDETTEHKDEQIFEIFDSNNKYVGQKVRNVAGNSKMNIVKQILQVLRDSEDQSVE